MTVSMAVATTVASGAASRTHRTALEMVRSVGFAAGAEDITEFQIAALSVT
jgi:hypothetical protein